MKLDRSVQLAVILLAVVPVACSSENDAGPATSAVAASTQGVGTTGILPPDMEMPLADSTSAANSTAAGTTTAAGGLPGVGGAGQGTGTTGLASTSMGGATLTSGGLSSATTADMSGSSVTGMQAASTTQGTSSTTAGAGGTTTQGTSSTTQGVGGTQQPEGQCAVQPLTAEFRQNYDDLDPFYQKYADANGLPVISSLAPADEALSRVCELVIDMVSARPDVLAALISNHIRFAIIGEDELTNDIPEYSYLDDSINTRARGLGGTPAASCAEESILCNTELDRWRGEGICVHEFAHTIATGGLFPADPTFRGRLEDAYQSARSSGLFANTYAMENFQEYWAEGVQNWYYTNLEADPPNGIHNFVDRREELQEYDPTLYNLIAEFLPDVPQFVDCYSDE